MSTSQQRMPAGATTNDPVSVDWHNKYLFLTHFTIQSELQTAFQGQWPLPSHDTIFFNTCFPRSPWNGEREHEGKCRGFYDQAPKWQVSLPPHFIGQNSVTWLLSHCRGVQEIQPSHLPATKMKLVPRAYNIALLPICKTL